MSWQAYKLVFKAQSPICIGYHTLGFIQRTRYYIPARNIWGALTANLTRNVYGENGKQPTATDYQTVGDEINEKIRFSYFYPSADGEVSLLPEYQEGKGLVMTSQGGVDKELAQFERVFVGSFMNTSVAADTFTAADDTLHEVEYLSPHLRCESEQSKRLHFIGYIFIKNDNVEPYNWDYIKQALQNIRVGAEQKYGFGQLSLDDRTSPVPDPPDGKIPLFNGNYMLDLNNLTLMLQPQPNKPIPIISHLDMENVNPEIELSGDFEPLVSSGWQKGGFGKRYLGHFWVPGTTTGDKLTVCIAEDGILRKYNGLNATGVS